MNIELFCLMLVLVIAAACAGIMMGD